MLNIIIALFILNIMVVAHEFGHYILARRNGIQVDEFAIGFGPTLLAWKAYGTNWMIKAFPLGGYNGLKGESEAEAGQGNFVTASKKAKLQVLFAGSLMNILLAVIAFYISLGLTGWKSDLFVEFSPVGAVITQKNGNYPSVVGYTADSPLAKLGIKTPFEVVSVNGNLVTSAEDISREISTTPDDVAFVRMQIIVEGQSQSIQSIRNENKKLGIQIMDPIKQIDYSFSWWSIALSGISHSVNTVIMTGKIMGMVFEQVFTSRDATALGYAFAGPVAIVATVGAVVSESKQVIADLASLTGMIGVSLALFNLFPFPGLDGWHIFLIGYEKVMGRKPNEKLVNTVSALGIMFLLTLGVIIMFKDVWLFFLKK